MKRSSFLKALGLIAVTPSIVKGLEVRGEVKPDLRKRPMLPEECYVPQFRAGDTLTLMDGSRIIVVQTNYLKDRPEITCIGENCTVDLGSGIGCKHVYELDEVPAFRSWVWGNQLLNYNRLNGNN